MSPEPQGKSSQEQLSGPAQAQVSGPELPQGGKQPRSVEPGAEGAVEGDAGQSPPDGSKSQSPTSRRSSSTRSKSWEGNSKKAKWKEAKTKRARARQAKAKKAKAKKAKVSKRQRERRRRKATYHCTARCVRRVFLCGRDRVTGKDYSHRKEWIRQRHKQLAELFTIDVTFRTELSNHLHVVLRTHPDAAKRLSDDEVARRWLTATRLAKRMDNTVPEVDPGKLEELLNDKAQLEEVRERLSDISWYMAVLLENIARRINDEEGATGCVWDGPFRRREVTDLAGLLIVGVYVDLNETRAGEADSLETSRHSSFFDRRQSLGQEPFSPERADAYLAEFTQRPERKADWEWAYKSRTGKRATDLGTLPMTLEDYEKLLRWTLAILQSGQRTTIPKHLGVILEKLSINTDAWVSTVSSYGASFCRVVGPPADIRQVAERDGVRHLKGITAASNAFA